jgi:DNA-binding IclR family transcriptional regulator
MTRNMLLIYAYEAYKWRTLSIARDIDEEPTVVAQAVADAVRDGLVRLDGRGRLALTPTGRQQVRDGKDPSGRFLPGVTRSAILEQLARGVQGARDVAAAIGRPSSAVRWHLLQLHHAGVVARVSSGWTLA